MAQISLKASLTNNYLRIAILTVALLLFLLSNVNAGKTIDQSGQGYWLGIPSVVSAEKKLPVLICLPGWGVAAGNDINVWAFPADKKGFLLIDLAVNYSTQTPEQIDQHIQNILNEVSMSYNIDQNNLFIAGTSAGGMMAISLALSHPGRFKAIAVISGARLDFGSLRKLSNASGQKFYFAHGTQDKSIPISEFYDTKDKLQANGAVIEFKVISEGGHTLPSGNYKDAVDWFYQSLTSSW